MNVGEYSKQVLDNYAKDQSSSARARVIFAHAAEAERDTGYKVGFTAAQRMAEHGMNQYDKYRESNMPHDKARDRAAADVERRFDSNGRDSQREAQQERPRSRAIGL